MSSRRQTQVNEALAHMAGEFLAREFPTTSLVTVTHAELSDNLKNVMVFISVLPETEEAASLKIAKRLRTDLRAFIKTHSFLHPIPVVDFVIDYGEKNRQRVDELTRKKPA